MEEKIKSIYINIVTGDAFGSVLEGLSKGHIKSIIGHGKNPGSYIEPDRITIKNRKWRKSGLYTSISQLMLITALTMKRKEFNRTEFMTRIQAATDLEGVEYGIFRHPGPVEKTFIEKEKNTLFFPSDCKIPSSRIIPSSTPLVFINKGRSSDINRILSFATIFTNDPLTTGGLLVYTALVYHFLFNKDLVKDIKIESVEVIRQTLNHLDDNSSLLFKYGYNPMTIINEVNRYLNIMELIKEINENHKVEQIICSELNKTLKTPVKRASIDNPLSVLTYSLHLAGSCLNPESASMEAAIEGGAASSLGSITGALSASIYGNKAVNDTLLKNIENRKRIIKIIDSLADMNIKEQLLDEFIESEVSLTKNEILQNTSLVKNLKQKQNKKLTRKEKEKRLTDHVVESWTKSDKAKWRKQKKSIEKQKHKKI